MTGINLDDFSRRLAEDRGYSYLMARTACRDVFDEMMAIFAEREDLSIAGFGKFEVKTKKHFGSIPKWAKETDLDKLESYPYLKFTPAENMRKSMYVGVPYYFGEGKKQYDYLKGKKTRKYGRRPERITEEVVSKDGE